MSRELTVRSTQSLADQVKMDRQQVELIKEQICPELDDGELSLFLHVAKRTGLDPMTRQVHAVKRYSNALKKKVMTIQTGIDGYRLQAERSGGYAGSDEAIFEPADESAKYPTKATVTVYKIVQGVRCPFTATARWSEYAPVYKDGNVGGLWPARPYGQLAKCAEALALRKAFPAELSDIYVKQEMEKADTEGHVITTGQTPPVTAAEIKVEREKKEAEKIENEGTGKPGAIGKPQIDELKKLVKECGVKSSAEVLDLFGTTVGRVVGKWSDLTLQDYAKLKMRLDGVKDGKLVICPNPIRFEDAPPEGETQQEDIPF